MATRIWTDGGSFFVVNESLGEMQRLIYGRDSPLVLNRKRPDTQPPMKVVIYPRHIAAMEEG